MNQLSFQNDELSALSASILRFLGSEEMEEVFRAQEAGEDAAVTEPLSRIPSLDLSQNLPEGLRRFLEEAGCVEGAAGEGA